jgi:hypothetical protein
VDPLALGLLKGDYAAGDTVLVDAEEGGLSFTRTRPAPDQPQEPAAVA